MFSGASPVCSCPCSGLDGSRSCLVASSSTCTPCPPSWPTECTNRSRSRWVTLDSPTCRQVACCLCAPCTLCVGLLSLATAHRMQALCPAPGSAPDCSIDAFPAALLPVYFAGAGLAQRLGQRNHFHLPLPALHPLELLALCHGAKAVLHGGHVCTLAHGAHRQVHHFKPSNASSQAAELSTTPCLNHPGKITMYQCLHLLGGNQAGGVPAHKPGVCQPSSPCILSAFHRTLLM